MQQQQDGGDEEGEMEEMKEIQHYDESVQGGFKLSLGVCPLRHLGYLNEKEEEWVFLYRRIILGGGDIGNNCVEMSNDLMYKK